MGGERIEPHFLNLGTSRRKVVSFTPRPLYPWGKSPRYPLDRRLGGLQSRSGRCGEQKILDPTGTRTPTPRRPASSQSLYRLSYPNSHNTSVTSRFFFCSRLFNQCLSIEIAQRRILESLMNAEFKKKWRYGSLPYRGTIQAFLLRENRGIAGVPVEILIIAFRVQT
jgi:hypothetical protein